MKFKKIGDEYVSFYCPGCAEEHNIPVKPHAQGWDFNGDYEKPTLAPSILRYAHDATAEDGQFYTTFRCHSFVRDGKIEFLSDCTHPLANKTVDLPEV